MRLSLCQPALGRGGARLYRRLSGHDAVRSGRSHRGGRRTLHAHRARRGATCQTFRSARSSCATGLIARGRNLDRAKDDPTAHGEMVAIRRCLAAYDRKALRGQHPLHDRRTVRHVHGGDPVVPLRPARFRGVGGAARDTNGSDHDFERGAGAPAHRSRRSRSRAACWRTRRWRCFRRANDRGRDDGSIYRQLSPGNPVRATHMALCRRLPTPAACFCRRPAVGEK